MKGLIAFFEIPAIDFNRAIKFYETILNTKMVVHDWGEEKMAFFIEEGGECHGAIAFAPDFKPAVDGVLVSLNCEDIDKTLLIVEENGGRISVPKTAIKVKDKGFFSLIIDSEGNRISLYCPK